MTRALISSMRSRGVAGWAALRRGAAARIVPGALRSWAARHRRRGTAPPSLSFRLVPGHQQLPPHITVLIVRDPAVAGVSEEAVLRWVSKQTCGSVEVIEWTKGSGALRRRAPEESRWFAGDVRSLAGTVGGRYVCIASPHLLRQPATYLETSLIALEAHGLAFTSEVCPSLPRVGPRVGGASVRAPLLGQIVRWDCLSHEYSIDLAAWLRPSGEKWVLAGMLMPASCENNCSRFAVPCEPWAVAGDLAVMGHYVLARSRGGRAPRSITAPVHPVHTVLSPGFRPSPLPTVLVTMPFLAVGGAERVTWDVISCLRARIRFVVVTLERHDPSLGSMVGSFRALTPYVYTAPDYLPPELTLSHLQYIMARFRPQTLYIANGCSWIYDAVAALRRANPQLRIVNQVYDHRVGWIQRYDRALTAAVDLHIASNERICRAYAQRGARPGTIRLIHNGVDGAEFDPGRYPADARRELRVRFGLPTDGRVVAMIARLHPQKRPLDFVHLARALSSDESVHFLMVGDGPMAATVDQEISALRLTNIVRHAFHLPMADLVAISDLVVLPSEYEGMSMVVLQAQAMGRPVVATDVGNNRSILESTEGGIVLPRIGSIPALRTAVLALLSHPPDPAAVRQRALRLYSLDTMAAEYEQVLLGDRHA